MFPLNYSVNTMKLRSQLIIEVGQGVENRFVTQNINKQTHMILFIRTIFAFTENDDDVSI